MNLELSLFWMFAAVGSLLLECVIQRLIPIWFGCGAVAAWCIAFFWGNSFGFGIQLICFLMVSALCLVLVRPLLFAIGMALARPRAEQFWSAYIAENADQFLGQTAIVTEEINRSLSTGEVLIDEMRLKAYSNSEDPIPLNSKVTVLEIEGLELLVTPVCTTIPSER